VVTTSTTRFDTKTECVHGFCTTVRKSAMNFLEKIKDLTFVMKSPIFSESEAEFFGVLAIKTYKNVPISFVMSDCLLNEF
jgi:hypothetical protein